jgi:hypothetical protein
MKNFYIADKAAWDKFPKEHFSYSHWILSDDPAKILVAADFHTDTGQDFWESAAGVQTLPNFLLTTDAVKPEHQVMLASMGVKAGDKTVDVARKAAILHPGFRPDRF